MSTADSSSESTGGPLPCDPVTDEFSDAELDEAWNSIPVWPVSFDADQLVLSIGTDQAGYSWLGRSMGDMTDEAAQIDIAGPPALEHQVAAELFEPEGTSAAASFFYGNHGRLTVRALGINITETMLGPVSELSLRVRFLGAESLAFEYRADGGPWVEELVVDTPLDPQDVVFAMLAGSFIVPKVPGEVRIERFAACGAER